MAQYRLSAQMIGRSSGRSATAAAAYRAGSRIVDHETGIIHDYTAKRGVMHTEIITPANTPEWMKDREQLWNAVHTVETRKNSQLARELQLSLPHELTAEQQANLVRRFVEEQCVERGMIADIAIHAPSPDPQADERNFHAHVLLTTREFIGGEWAKNKNRDWHKTEMIEEWTSMVVVPLPRAQTPSPLPVASFAVIVLCSMTVLPLLSPMPLPVAAV